jgi:chromosome segregation protein
MGAAAPPAPAPLVDERVEQVFTRAYRDTAREFEGVFSRLFPGGGGPLALTGPDNMLTTGVPAGAEACE